MRCRNCGTKIADKALICYRCGTATTEAKFKAPAAAGRRWPRHTLGYTVAVVLLVLLAILLLLARSGYIVFRIGVAHEATSVGPWYFVLGPGSVLGPSSWVRITEGSGTGDQKDLGRTKNQAQSTTDAPGALHRNEKSTRSRRSSAATAGAEAESRTLRTPLPGDRLTGTHTVHS